jgi:hypothetical protein
MTKVLTVEDVIFSLDDIVDEMAADPDKVVTFADKDGKRFVLISPQHYERLKQVISLGPDPDASVSGGVSPINDLP